MSTFFIAAPLVVFCIFVAPLWLILHYRSKKTVSGALSATDYQRLQVLSEQAETLQERVKTLEKILDTESPTWRNQHGG